MSTEKLHVTFSYEHNFFIPVMLLTIVRLLNRTGKVRKVQPREKEKGFEEAVWARIAH